ncbi:MAG: TIGR03986 family CRISPR-associated RAMP protein [Candidatus Hydrogenedentes bacterium]|nr:TIGR03986 family CRISPR-associated RAMP protein [Candidatus Hydrogenedentota bacterium]
MSDFAHLYLPRHKNPPREHKDRIAKAPYNFVPPPEQMLQAHVDTELWNHHDEFVPDTYSGWIDVKMETLSPLYIRGPQKQVNGAWDTRETRIRPEPCLRHDGRAMIPGSSMRGMVRNLFEILTFSKIQPVTSEKNYFRSLAGTRDRLYNFYMDRMNSGAVQTGFLEKQGKQWRIRPCEAVKVSRTSLESAFGQYEFPEKPGAWDVHLHECRFRHKGPVVTDIKRPDQLSDATGWMQGWLVLTGDVPGKKKEWLFYDKSTNDSACIDIPETVWQQFNSDEQLSQFQERYFKRNKPVNNGRRRDGWAREGDAVFFTTHTVDGAKQVMFFGRAGMFRFPYDLSPEDMVPPALREGPLDMTEALFGIVSRKKGSKGGAVKGRLSFEDAVTPGTDFRLEGGPKYYVLAGPKPSCFQQYLVQDGRGGDASGLVTYLRDDRGSESRPNTTIRGHKLFWHRWEGNMPPEFTGRRVPEQSRMDSAMDPVRAGVEFKGCVRFYNLSKIELGALMATLNLPEGMAHKLGQAKPLGLGSVRVSASLVVIDRQARYASWEATGETRPDTTAFTQAFEAHVLAHAQATGEALLEGRKGLRRVARLNTLFTMLEFDKRPKADDTRYLRLDDPDEVYRGSSRGRSINAYRYRPVLPTPEFVAGDDNDAWVDRPAPQPARPPVVTDVRSGGGGSQRPGAQHGPRVQAVYESRHKQKPPKIKGPKPERLPSAGGGSFADLLKQGDLSESTKDKDKGKPKK